MNKKIVMFCDQLQSAAFTITTLRLQKELLEKMQFR